MVVDNGHFKRCRIGDAPVVEATETIDEVCEELAVGALVTWTVLIKDGPSGWPVIRFVGQREELEKVINAYEPAYAPAAS